MTIIWAAARFFIPHASARTAERRLPYRVGPKIHRKTWISVWKTPEKSVGTVPERSIYNMKISTQSI